MKYSDTQRLDELERLRSNGDIGIEESLDEMGVVVAPDAKLYRTFREAADASLKSTAHTPEPLSVESPHDLSGGNPGERR